MLNFLYENNVEVHNLLTERQNEAEIECVIPFNPYRKSQLTVTKLKADDKKDKKFVRVVLKGAPEVVIDRCIKFLSEGMNEAIPIKDEKHRE
jgi:magnesium-transporting ATPase (P-type)